MDLDTITYYLNSNFTILKVVLEDTSNILRRSSPIISTVDMSHKFVYANMHVNEGSTNKNEGVQYLGFLNIILFILHSYTLYILTQQILFLKIFDSVGNTPIQYEGFI